MLNRIAMVIILSLSSFTLSGYSLISEQQSFLKNSQPESTFVSGGAWLLELMGVSKREILVKVIIAAINSQIETKEQFETALEEFKSVIEFEGGELEQIYNQLNNEYEKSIKKSNSFNQHIEDVERVSERLFIEWEQEIEIYEDYNLREASSRKLAITQAECQTLIASMRQAEVKIEPVLIMFRDRVLFLKHNLNAEAIAAIESDLSLIRFEIDELTTEIQNSIDEADRFINNLES